jgi:hypothetical protein
MPELAGPPRGRFLDEGTGDTLALSLRGGGLAPLAGDAPTEPSKKQNDTMECTKISGDHGTMKGDNAYWMSCRPLQFDLEWTSLPEAGPLPPPLHSRNHQMA